MFDFKRGWRCVCLTRKEEAPKRTKYVGEEEHRCEPTDVRKIAFFR